MSEIYKRFSKNTTNIGGVKRISGIDFLNHNGRWSATVGDIKYTMAYDMPYKCQVTDKRDGYSIGFMTVAGAKAFAKRRRHGRTLEEHKLAEKLLCLRDELGLKLSDISNITGKSIRTIEAYFSGARAVPYGVVETVVSAFKKKEN
nr:hypothetical protein [uncultured Desulfobacter sp.]